MFMLHETTRRRLAQRGFLCLALLPALALLVGPTGCAGPNIGRSWPPRQATAWAWR